MTYFLISIIYLFGNIVEVISGFGSTIVTVSLGAIIYPIDKIIFVLFPLGITLSSYIVIKHRKHLKPEILTKEVLPFMGTGFVMGIYILSTFSISSLKNFYGILVLILGLRGLYLNIFKNDIVQKPISKNASSLFIFLSGIVQGIYSSGGPLLVYGLSSKNIDKDTFRVTLSSVWLIFSILLFSFYLITSKSDLKDLTLSVYLIPSLIIGIFVGEKIHHLINERYFKILIFSILLIAGISLSLSKSS